MELPTMLSMTCSNLRGSKNSRHSGTSLTVFISAESRRASIMPLISRDDCSEGSTLNSDASSREALIRFAIRLSIVETLDFITPALFFMSSSLLFTSNTSQVALIVARGVRMSCESSASISCLAFSCSASLSRADRSSSRIMSKLSVKEPKKSFLPASSGKSRLPLATSPANFSSLLKGFK